MAKQVQWRRGTTQQNDSFTGAEGEITIDMGENYGIVDDTGDSVYNPFTLRVHDDKTKGGWKLVNEDILSKTITETLMNLNNPDPDQTPFLLHSGGNYMTGTLRSKMGAYLADGNQTHNTTAINIMYPLNDYRDILFSSTVIDATTDENGDTVYKEIEGGSNRSVIRSVSQQIGGVDYNSIYIGNYSNTIKTGLPASYLHIKTNTSTGETEFIIKPDSYLSPDTQLYSSIVSNSSTLNYVATTGFVKNYTATAIEEYVSTNVRQFELKPATKTTLGGVIVGNGLDVDNTGTISISGLSGSSTGDTRLIYWNGSKIINSTKTVGSATKPIFLSGGTFTAISATVGSATKPIFLDGGSLKAISATVGNSGQPVYFNDGVITACNVDSIVSGSGHSATIASGTTLGHIKVGSGLSITEDGTLSTTGINPTTLIGSNVGSATNPVYVNKTGTIVASNGTVGSINNPVYLNAGVITECANFDLPIGSIVFFALGVTPPSGKWLKCAGGEYLKTKYQALADKIGTYYGTPSDNTKFKLPDFRKRVPWQGDSYIDGYVTSALPNIKGHFQFKNFGHAYNNVGVDGAFTVESSGIRGADGKHGGFKVIFDASKSNTIYGSANIVRPPGVGGNWYIKYA